MLVNTDSYATDQRLQFERGEAMKRVALSFYLLSIALSSSLVWHRAAAGDALEGYAEFKFGMSIQDINSIANVKQADEENGGEWYVSTVARVVNGVDYNIRFWFEDAQLSKINLNRRLNVEEKVCENEFQTLYGQIKAVYGESDLPPERTVWGRNSGMISAKKTFSDGATVRFGTIFLTFCNINIVYARGKTGSTF